MNALIAVLSLIAFPAQAQASELAVPMHAPKHLTLRDHYKYAGAVLIVQCKLVYGLMLIDKDAKIEPQHLVRDMTREKLLQLLSQVNPDNIWQSETPCGRDQAT